MDEPPNYLVLGKTHQDWITIHHNSFSKIENWGVELSKVFHTKLLIIHYSWNSIFYFAAYDKGEKKREIHLVSKFRPEQNSNFGEKYSFEKEAIGLNSGDKSVFDSEAIKRYCSENGLNLNFELQNILWQSIYTEKEIITIEQLLKQVDEFSESKKEKRSFFQKISRFFTKK